MEKKDSEQKVKKPPKARAKVFLWITVIIISMIIGAAMKGSKETTKEVPVEKKTTEKCDYSKWKELKAIDDRGFQKAAEGFDIVSEILTAASKLDVVKMATKTKELEAKTDEVNGFVDERRKVLKELGY